MCDTYIYVSGLSFQTNQNAASWNIFCRLGLSADNLHNIRCFGFLLTGINYSIQSVEQVARLTVMSGCSEDLDEDEWVGDDDDEDKPRVGAMPQRSLHIKTKVKPIPEPSSLFIFSSTNPYE